METMAFWIDRDYDADRASDEVSRYGHYVRDAAAREAEDLWPVHDAELARVDFSALAWRSATGPVMSPGYVRYHRLITGARVMRSPWDGTLTATVSVATPPPAAIVALGTRWRGWEQELAPGDGYRPVAPYDEQVCAIARSRHTTGYALTTVELVVPLPEVAAALPDLPASPDSPRLVPDAALAVGVLVGALNDAVTPVIDALQGA